ncbi:MAG: hypothetical protein Q9170_004053 [Blastenia crenularia]
MTSTPVEPTLEDLQKEKRFLNEKLERLTLLNSQLESRLDAAEDELETLRKTLQSPQRSQSPATKQKPEEIKKLTAELSRYQNENTQLKQELAQVRADNLAKQQAASNDHTALAEGFSALQVAHSASHQAEDTLKQKFEAMKTLLQFRGVVIDQPSLERGVQVETSFRASEIDNPRLEATGSPRRQFRSGSSLAPSPGPSSSGSISSGHPRIFGVDLSGQVATGTLALQHFSGQSSKPLTAASQGSRPTPPSMTIQRSQAQEKRFFGRKATSDAASGKRKRSQSPEMFQRSVRLPPPHLRGLQAVPLQGFERLASEAPSSSSDKASSAQQQPDISLATANLFNTADSLTGATPEPVEASSETQLKIEDPSEEPFASTYATLVGQKEPERELTEEEELLEIEAENAKYGPNPGVFSDEHFKVDHTAFLLRSRQMSSDEPPRAPNASGSA